MLPPVRRRGRMKPLIVPRVNFSARRLSSMRRVIAVVMVVFLGAGQAAADYLRIKVDLKNATPNPPTANVRPGQVGGFPKAGFGGKNGIGGFGQPIPGNIPPTNDPNAPEASP